MHRQLLLTDLKKYVTSAFITPEQYPVVTRFIDFVTAHEECFHRSNSGHVTSGAWIVNPQKTHALLTHHKKFNMWCQLGGHNDGDHRCNVVALKEAHEESGIHNLVFLHKDIFDIDIHPIPGTCGYHYDVRYLLQAPADDAYTVSNESHDLAWVSFEEIHRFTSEASVLRMNEKALRFLRNT